MANHQTFTEENASSRKSGPGLGVTLDRVQDRDLTSAANTNRDDNLLDAENGISNDNLDSSQVQIHALDGTITVDHKADIDLLDALTPIFEFQSTSSS